MDMWKYYDITHRKHIICNPTSEAKLSELMDLVLLDRGRQVVDVACGKGEFLIQIAEKYRVRGLGIDRSPYYLEEARRRHAIGAARSHFSKSMGPISHLIQPIVSRWHLA